MKTLLSLLLLMLLASAEAAEPPGVVVAHSPTKTRKYIGSPSLVRLPSGVWLASHDHFGPGSEYNTSFVYSSSDDGKSWKLIATLKGQWWSTLFVHEKEVYILGTTKEYGQTVIRKSSDEGKTWSTPRDANSGLLLAEGMYHCAPVPVVIHGGRIWRAMEEYTGPKWGAFKAFVMSAPVGADLLKAENWTSSNRLDRNPEWLEGKFQAWLEGNIVPTPEGSLVNILRVQQPHYDEVAAVVEIVDAKTIRFDPKTGFRPWPGGAKKFQVRLDPQTQTYWMLSNPIPEKYRVKPFNPGQIRNTLSLFRSTDLKSWTEVQTVLHDPAVKTSGFQYPDWVFDGDDLVAAVRTAFPESDGTLAHNMHDANWLTFHRLPGIRKRPAPKK
jgi:hypothetical protein